MEKRNGDVDQKLPDNSDVATATAKIKKVKNKIQVFSSLVKKASYNTEISDIEKSILLLLIILNL